MKEKYCPILTKTLEPHLQKRVVCLEEKCAWWEPSYDECTIVSIGRSLSHLEGIGDIR